MQHVQRGPAGTQPTISNSPNSNSWAARGPLRAARARSARPAPARPLGLAVRSPQCAAAGARVSRACPTRARNCSATGASAAPALADCPYGLSSGCPSAKRAPGPAQKTGTPFRLRSINTVGVARERHTSECAAMAGWTRTSGGPAKLAASAPGPIHCHRAVGPLWPRSFTWLPVGRPSGELCVRRSLCATGSAPPLGFVPAARGPRTAHSAQLTAAPGCQWQPENQRRSPRL